MTQIERFIATRYLFTRERKALLTAITVISVSGVAIGVAALIIVLGVMDGAEEHLFGKVIEIYPHARVVSLTGDELHDVGPLIDRLSSMPEVALAEAVVNKQALLASSLGAEAELVAAQIVGVRDLASTRLYPAVPVGEGSSLDLGPGEVALGEPLAELLGLSPGDSLLVVTGLASSSANRRRPSVRLRVAGVFSTAYHQFDVLTAFVSAETARKSFGEGGHADYIHLKLKDPLAAAAFGERLRFELGPAYRVVTWVDEQGFFFQSIKLQKLALYIILMLIVLVAGFNIVGTLILMVIDKTRQIGILKAIGASDAMIARIFVGSGMIIGLLGTAIGVALGAVGCFLLARVIDLDMPPSVYNFENLPVTMKPLTVLVVVLSALGVCLIAAFFPARQAASLDPVEALRHE